MCDRLLIHQHNRAVKREPHYWPKEHPGGCQGSTGMHRAPQAEAEQSDGRLLWGCAYTRLSISLTTSGAILTRFLSVRDTYHSMDSHVRASLVAPVTEQLYVAE